MKKLSWLYQQWCFLHKMVNINAILIALQITPQGWRSNETVIQKQHQIRYSHYYPGHCLGKKMTKKLLPDPSKNSWFKERLVIMVCSLTLQTSVLSGRVVQYVVKSEQPKREIYSTLRPMYWPTTACALISFLQAPDKRIIITCPSEEPNISFFKEQKEFLLSLTEDKPIMHLPSAEESCDKGGCVFIFQLMCMDNLTSTLTRYL